MTALKWTLYVVAALFLLSGLFVFLPWGTLNAYMVAFQAPPYPDAPVVQYTVKVFLLITFWVGVLLALAVRRPQHYQAVLLVLGGMCVSAAVACLALGVTYGVPAFFYGDAASSAVIGLLVLLYRDRALRSPRA